MAMKTDSIQFDTRKDLNQIANVLRATGGQIEKINNDALGGLGTSSADIEVVISGEERKGLFNSVAGYWAVQVYVIDQGAARHVELIALGESTMTKIMSGAKYGSNVMAAALSRERFFEMKFSKIHRDEIARALS